MKKRILSVVLVLALVLSLLPVSVLADGTSQTVYVYAQVVDSEGNELSAYELDQLGALLGQSYTLNNDGWMTLGKTTMTLSQQPQENARITLDSQMLEAAKNAVNGTNGGAGLTRYTKNTGIPVDKVNWDSLAAFDGAADYDSEAPGSQNKYVWHLDGKIAIGDVVGLTVKAENVTETYDGEEHEIAAPVVTVSGAAQNHNVATAAPVIVYKDGDGNAISGVPVDAGTYTAEVSVSLTGSYSWITATTTATVTINKRAVTLTSADATKEYDGTALTNDTVTVSGDGFVEGEGATYTVTGSQKWPGSSSNEFTYSLNAGTKAENYEITKKEGTLTVTDRTDKYEITVEANSGTATYDGQAHSVSGFKTLEFTANGQKYTVSGLSASASGTDAGTYTVAITGNAVVKDSDSIDVTSQFIVTTANGTLTINKRSVTLTSETASKEYDGTALTRPDVTVGGDGFVAGEVSNIRATGTVTYANDVVQNSIAYDTGASFKAGNYTITEQVGQLSITNRTAKYQVEVKANSGTFTYDGAVKTVTGFETLEVTAGNGLTYTVSGLTASASGTDANTYTVSPSGTYVVKDAAGIDVTAQFIVTATPGTLTINKRAVTLTSADATREFDGNPLTDSTVTVGGEGFVTGQGVTCTVTGSQTLAGSSTNYFTYTWNDGTNSANYEITKIEGTLTVTNRSTPYTIEVEANSGEYLYDGNEKTVSGLKQTTFAVEGHTYTVSGLSASAAGTNAGTYAVNVTGVALVEDAGGNDVTAQFSVTNKAGTLTINKRTVTLTSATASKMYDGVALTNHTITVGGDGWAGGEGATYTVTGSQKLSGSSSNAFTYALNAGTSADNYNISTHPGTLTVTDREGDARYEITVTANSGEYLYDGTAKTVSGFETLSYSFEVEAGGERQTVAYTVSGLSASVTATDAGTYPVAITGEAVVRDSDGNDVTSQFIVKTVDGELKINKRSVTLTSASDSKEFDGTPLTNSEVTVTGDGWATGEGATYTVTGSQTLAGNSGNTFDYTLNGNTNPANYTITKTEGTLTVMHRTAKYEITVEGNSDTVKYDGSEHSVSGIVQDTFTVDGLTYRVTGATASGKGTDAGEYAVAVDTTGAKVLDANGNDVSAEFAVKTQAGKLTIDKRQVTLTSASATKEYDGIPLTNSEVTVSGDGWADGEGAAYDVTGSQTLQGFSENAFTYTLNAGTKADNYTITKHEGQLTVITRSAPFEIEVEANSGEYLYDGDAKTVSGFKTLTFTLENGATFTVTGLSAGVTKTDAGTYTINVEGTAAVWDANNNDVTDQFAVTSKPGQLKINQRTVTLTSGSAEKEFDGTPLTKHEVKVTGDGWADGEGATYSYTGSQTLAGSSANYFAYALNEGTKAENYVISTEEGTLTVYRAAITEAELEATGYTGTYDGESHNGVTAVDGINVVEGLDWTYAYSTDGETYSAEMPQFKDVGEYTVYVKASNSNYADDLYTTAAVKITPAEVTVTADDRSKLVGDPLPELTYTVATAVASETPAFTGALAYEGDDTRGVHTGEITQGTLALTDGENFKASNYTLVFVPGTLTINARGLQVEKTVDKTSARVGDTLTYTITVRNTGDVTLEQIIVTDEMLDKTETIESLKPDEQWSVTYTYTVKLADAGKTLANTAVAAVDGEEMGEGSSEGTEIERINTSSGKPNTPQLEKGTHFNYILGYSDGTIRPNNEITRAEVAIIFFRLLTEESRSAYYSEHNDFTDVADTAKSNIAISTLTNAGILTGYSDGTFRPNAKVTRGQLAAIIARFAEMRGSVNKTFTDIDGYWAKDLILLAASNGWIDGYGDGTFRPAANITRAQTMAIINRALDRQVSTVEDLLDDMNVWVDNMDPKQWYYFHVQEATNYHEYTRKAGTLDETWTKKLPDIDWSKYQY
ncbi:MAG: S-layer homology domain-containing protein [Oscillospiraceae bacterium]